MFNAEAPKTSAKANTKGKPSGSPYETVPDWNQIGTFTAGLGIGAMLGAAVAILWAPGRGEETRQRISRRFSPAGEDSLWESLGNELKRAASRRKPIDAEEVEELEEIEAFDFPEDA